MNLFKSNKVKIIFGLTISSFFVLVLFQNCQNNPGDNFSKLNYGKTVSSSSASTNESSSLQPSSSFLSNSASTTAKITVSSEGQVDCSSAGATIGFEVNNIGTDALGCMEYSLDMPTSSPRYGEKFLCDNSSKFRTVSSLPDWTYDQSTRSYRTLVAPLRNHSFIVPGSYVMVVKDNQGAIYRSNVGVVKKQGAINCFLNPVSTASSNTGGVGGCIVAGPSTQCCGWVTDGSHFSPIASAPAKSCSSSNSGERIQVSSGYYKCSCR